MLTLEEAQACVICAVVQIQELGARPVPVVTPDLCPLEDLEGFDSLNAEEVCMLLSEDVDFEVTLSVFQGPHDRHASVAEIADNLCRLIAEQKRELYDQC